MHMRDRADADGSDLLLVDTGDRVEGNGLYDASEPKGLYTSDIFKEQDIDVICSGNHELYKQNSSKNEFHRTVPDFKGNYLASNLDIYNPETEKFEPLAPRFKKFITKNQGIRILAFGFLYDFAGNANNTVVRTIKETIREDWFQEAIRDRDVDLFLIIGHVPVRSPEYTLLFKTIRAVQWDVPIAFLGGHTHIRDYTTYDRKAAALESGRYMETIGFMSIDGLSTGGSSGIAPAPAKKGITFARRYVDNNLFSMYHHSRKNESTFPTEHGRNVSALIASSRKNLELDKLHGCAPRNLWVNRAPYPSDASIFTWLEKHVLPEQLSSSAERDGRPALAITNTGAMRFDIFKGAFTKDSTFLVCPFTSGFRYVKDVPYGAASKVLSILNNEGPIMQEVEEKHGLQSWMLVSPEQSAARRGSVPTDDKERLVRGAGQQVPLSESRGEKLDLIPGYTTHDDAGDDGDDTLHSKIAFYNVPNCIQAPVNFPRKNAAGVLQEPETVDLIYNEFIQVWVLQALKYLGEEYSSDDTEAYMEGKTFTDVITDWVSENWGTDGEVCP
ncbi:hypothetical protein H2201_006173 [Coniosporium apollinis]|uniref:Calcineurin-like phosphoesterase domain-containing protein n=1 Tax=Coniosporium apollinis TaxID=61459 RepID=A0ABQ9NMQ9_9PEZI|nr:hypothetical protein H2201_006173 [Coniosporium apollinis]